MSEYYPHYDTAQILNEVKRILDEVVEEDGKKRYVNVTIGVPSSPNTTNAEHTILMPYFVDYEDASQVCLKMRIYFYVQSTNAQAKIDHVMQRIDPAFEGSIGDTLVKYSEENDDAIFYAHIQDVEYIDGWTFYGETRSLAYETRLTAGKQQLYLSAALHCYLYIQDVKEST